MRRRNGFSFWVLAAALAGPMGLPWPGAAEREVPRSANCEASFEVFWRARSYVP